MEQASISFTQRELDVMAVLWARGSGTVTEVRDALAEEFAYTTVLTVLRTLEQKGYVGHLAEGRTFRYLPAVAAQAAGRSALDRILDTMFAGSHELLLTQLVSDRRLDKKKLRQLRAVLDERLEARTERDTR
jgi:BlaI family transcriptional regulator, penicillinase repressor